MIIIQVINGDGNSDDGVRKASFEGAAAAA